jgi:hypothetical protein
MLVSRFRPPTPVAAGGVRATFVLPVASPPGNRCVPASLPIRFGPGHVTVINGSRRSLTGTIPDTALHANFFAYAAGFPGGARVRVSDLTFDGVAEIVTITGRRSAAQRLRL